MSGGKIMSGGEIGVGVIGLGFMGRTHLESFSRIPACRIAAVVDKNPERLTGESTSGGNLDTGGDFVSEVSEAAMFRSVESMLADCEVDLAVVTTPTPTHVEIATRLVEAGCHVLVEKPVSLDLDAISKLDDAARERGVIAMPAHCMRFWPAWAWIHHRILERSCGDVIRAAFRRTGAVPDWNPDFYQDTSRSGGAIVDLHIHDTDFVLHCFGTPVAVTSVGSRSNVSTTYHYQDGPQVEAVGGWLDAPDASFTMEAEIECERGTISFVLGRDPEVEIRSVNGLITGHPEASEGGSGYDAQARAIIAAISEGGGDPPVSMVDAIRAGRVLEYEIRSVESGGARKPVLI
ncbi:MAG: hypothetical protein CMJ52_11580 [Planctomycetaceae bacterium]|nr:hypothetical protein [Planctomycetaceae bacterium]